MEEERYLKVLNRLQTQCAKREYCSGDVFRKAVEALDGDRDAAAKMVASLVGDKFVDDLRYATAFARDKARLSGWGPEKISWLLSGKGIPKDTIRQALASIEPEDAARKMRSVLEAKARTLKGDPGGKLKLLKFALSRGYSYDVVSKVVDDLVKQESSP